MFTYNSLIHFIRTPFILAVLILALAACSTPPQKPVSAARGDYTYAREYLGWLIEQEMADADVTGLSIALVDNQEVVFTGFRLCRQAGRHQGNAGYGVPLGLHRQGIYRDGSDAACRAGQDDGCA